MSSHLGRLASGSRPAHHHRRKQNESSFAIFCAVRRRVQIVGQFSVMQFVRNLTPTLVFDFTPKTPPARKIQARTDKLEGALRPLRDRMFLVSVWKRGCGVMSSSGTCTSIAFALSTKPNRTHLAKRFGNPQHAFSIRLCKI